MTDSKPEVHTNTTPLTSSKLVPAAAPSISAWGKKLEFAAPAPAREAIKKEEWPSPDAVLSKEAFPPAAAAVVAKDSAKEKPKVSPPKVKSTGKEKWVPYEATIILPDSKNQNQKKNKNSNKKKQGQNGQTANQSNGKQKKDTQSNKSSNQNGQKRSTEGTQINKKSEKKQHNNGHKSPPDLNTVVDGIASLSVKADQREITNTIVESASITRLVPAENESVPVEVSQVASTFEQQESSIADDGSNTANTTPATGSTSATSPSNQNASSGGQGFNKKLPPFQPQQHRNSEPFASNNGFYYNNGNANNMNLRGRKTNKQPYGSVRHSVSGSGYNHNSGNIPYMVNNYGYGYLPVLNQFGYPGAYNSFTAPGSRSNSHSPSKGGFAVLNPPPIMGSIPPAVGIPPFVQPPVLYSPYASEGDQLTMVVNQLNYYFSNENLTKDFYLRRQMNSHGYVPLKKLIEFNRLKALTNGDYDMMLNALKLSPNLEVNNDKVRVITNWDNWVLPFDQRDATGKVEETVEEKETDKENKE